MASKAMAATTPWCCSLASTLRVPNRMVNSAIMAATPKASCISSSPPSGRPLAESAADTTWIEVVMALSCNAM